MIKPELKYVEFYTGADTSARDQFQQISAVLNSIVDLLAGSQLQYRGTGITVGDFPPAPNADGDVWIDADGSICMQSQGVLCVATNAAM